MAAGWRQDGGRMAAGAVVFDCRPALLPVSLDVSGIDMLAVRSSIPPAKTDVVPPEHEQPFGGGGGRFAWLYLSGVECWTPLLDSGTDLEDELPSPDASPVVIGHRVALLPAQVEENVDLVQVLAEFGTLPDAHVDLLVALAGPTVVPDDDVQPPTGSLGCSPIPLTTPVYILAWMLLYIYIYIYIYIYYGSRASPPPPPPDIPPWQFLPVISPPVISPLGYPPLDIPPPPVFILNIETQVMFNKFIFVYIFP